MLRRPVHIFLHTPFTILLNTMSDVHIFLNTLSNVNLFLLTLSNINVSINIHGPFHMFYPKETFESISEKENISKMHHTGSICFITKNRIIKSK